MTAAARPPELTPVPETMLITVYARAVETAKPRPLLRDPKAVEMVEAIDYDFSTFDGARSLFGSVLRTLVFDGWARRFLDVHPAGTVVELGTGLNTRFERLDNGRVSWVDLDLPEAIALRRRFFVDTDRRRMLAASMTDDEWPARVRELPGPYLFLAEASLIYLPDTAAIGVLRAIADGFPGGWVATDTCGRAFLASQDRHDVLKDMTARIAWTCDDPAGLGAQVPGLTLRDRYGFGRLPAPLLRRLPLPMQVAFPVVGTLDPRSRAYRMCLFATAGP